MRWLHRLWRRRTADVLGLLLVVAVAGGAAAVLLLAPTDRERPIRLAPSVTGLPICSEVDSALAADGRARCRDGGAVVELVAEKTPLVLDDLEVRVLGVERLRRALGVRLRLRNRSAEMRVVRDSRRQLYVDAGGRRVYGRIGRALRMKPRTDVAATAWFDGVGSVRPGERGVWLGVLPFAQMARAHPSRLGAIQLHVPPEAASPKAPSGSRPSASATTPTTPSRRPTTTSKRSTPKTSRLVRLTMVATAPVYVCLLAGQRVLVPGRTLQPGEQVGPFRAPRFTMTLGSKAIRMRVNGGPPIVPSGSPSGYVLDRHGPRLLPLGRSPTCGG
jgi:hypothetical protein